MTNALSARADSIWYLWVEQLQARSFRMRFPCASARARKAAIIFDLEFLSRRRESPPLNQSAAAVDRFEAIVAG